MACVALAHHKVALALGTHVRDGGGAGVAYLVAEEFQLLLTLERRQRPLGAIT